MRRKQKEPDRDSTAPSSWRGWVPPRGATAGSAPPRCRSSSRWAAPACRSAPCPACACSAQTLGATVAPWWGAPPGRRWYPRAWLRSRYTVRVLGQKDVGGFLPLSLARCLAFSSSSASVCERSAARSSCSFFSLAYFDWKSSATASSSSSFLRRESMCVFSICNFRRAASSSSRFSSSSCTPKQKRPQRERASTTDFKTSWNHGRTENGPFGNRKVPCKSRKRLIAGSLVLKWGQLRSNLFF